MTPKQEKMVGGLWCSQVLDRLSDYLDDDLDREARAAVEAHLGGCDGCARFGGELRGTIRALRRNLGASLAGPPPRAGAAARGARPRARSRLVLTSAARPRAPVLG